MRFIVTFLLIGIAIFVMLLREFNPGMITINVLPSKFYEISKSVFFLLSLAVGAGLSSSFISRVTSNGSCAGFGCSANRKSA